MQLICAFVFAYAKSRFSLDAAQIMCALIFSTDFLLLQKGFAYEKTFEAAELLYDSLTSHPSLRNEVVIDDRTKISIGGRVKLAKQGGYPFAIAAGKKVNFKL